MQAMDCPCGSTLSHDACCAPILRGEPAGTAEALMRSRYTAYVVRDYDHLQRSLSQEQRADFDRDSARRWAESSEWRGLTITGTTGGGAEDAEGTVAFVAKYRIDGADQQHVEIAHFAREEGRWVYTGHEEPAAQPVRRATPKTGRNDPCPCGSGKKFKKCCGAAA